MTRRAVVDLAVLTVLALLGVIGLETSFGQYNFLVASLGGLAVGVGVALLTTWLRLPVLLAVLAGILAYFLLGTPIVMPDQGIAVVLPSLTSLAGLALGAVFGWRDILTLQTPVQAPYYIAVLPYFASWLVGMVGGLLALRWTSRAPGSRRSAVLLIGPLLLFLVGILLGTREPYLAAIRGTAFAVVALIWLGWRRGARERVAVEGSSGHLRRRLVGVAVVVAGAVVLGLAGGAALFPPRDARYVLREEVQPPFDPREFASPLSGFRYYTKTVADDDLLEVSGLAPGGLIRLAVMDSYDGVIWRVSSSTAGAEGSGAFRLAGETLPEPDALRSGTAGVLDVTIDGYDDVWMPTAGYATGVRWEDEASSSLADTFRYNAVTGTAVMTGGLQQGYHYALDVEYPDTVDDDELAGVATANLQLPAADGVPDIVGATALELAGDARDPIDQLRAIEVALTTDGYLSHGLASDGIPSRAGHGADRMAELFERPEMVGDEEQYASAFALMARSLGYPSRVVMGFAPQVAGGESTATVVGSDVTAWVEVPFEGVGWVPFFPTPDQTDVPQDQVPKPQNEPQPQVRQPPRTETDQEDLLTPVSIQDSDERDDDGFVLPGWAVALGLSILIPAAIVFVPLLIVAAVKSARARRRRLGAGDRAAAGAWEELLDRLAELGYPVPPPATRVATAQRLAATLAQPQLVAVAARADAAVFSGRDIEPSEAEAVWSDVAGVVAQAESGAGRTRRLLSRYRVHRTGRREERRVRAAGSAARRTARRQDRGTDRRGGRR